MSLLPDPSSQVNPIYYQTDRSIDTINQEVDVIQQGIYGSPWEEQYMLPPMLPSLGDFLLPVQ
jgi:predicted DNA-binding protein YlxM (UPF0122 family)